MIDAELVHFGPVWGRPVSRSMALCMADKDPGLESRTMTRSATTVTCPACLHLMTDTRAIEAAHGITKGGAA
jgi:hypothetical protein